MSAVPAGDRRMRRLPFAAVSESLSPIAMALTYGSSVMALFVTELGFSKSQLGYVRSLLFLLGMTGPFFMPLLERIGLRRSFILFYGGRYVVLAGLAAAPLLAATAGLPSAVALVLAITVVFGLLRALAETAFLPWQHEFVPQGVFGRFQVVVSLGGSLVTIAALAFASRLLAASTDPATFQLLFLVAAASGLASIAFAVPIPGGEPRPAGPGSALLAVPPVAEVLRDRPFVRYLAGQATILFASTALATFLPLFLRETTRLPADVVVMLDGVTLAGSFASLFLWGAATDRFGGKPVLVTGLTASLVVAPAWILLPAGLPVTRIAAAACSAWQGMANSAVSIGGIHLLYATFVTAERRTTYMPVYYIVISVASAASPLLVGWLLDFMGGLIAAQPYLPLFATAVAFIAAALLLVRPIANPRGVRTREFLTLLLRGNLLQAAWARLRYGLALDEGSRLELARGIGDARSAFHSPRLVAALEDPSFLVRHEAVLALSRSHRHPEATEALVRVLASDDRELHAVAAWALGRLGDSAAIPALRRSLDGGDPVVQAAAVRSLGMLRDAGSVQTLMGVLADSSRRQLHAACGTALSRMGAVEAIPLLLESLSRPGSHPSDGPELALAVARLAGREREFVALWRRSRREPALDLAAAAVRARPDAQPSLREDERRAATLALILSWCAERLARQPASRPEVRILELACRS